MRKDSIMIKIIVVGDALVSSENMEKAAYMLHLNDEIKVEKFEWFSELSKDEFQKKILLIESSGSENIPIPDGILAVLPDADYLLVHLAPVSQTMVRAGTNLKMIGVSRGGLENINIQEAAKHNIPVIHVIRNAVPVAEFTLGLILAETRNIAKSHYSIKTGGWEKEFSNAFYKTTLSNLKVGLVGLGNIGKLLVEYLQALNIEVQAYDPFVSAEELMRENITVKKVSLQEIFENSDIVSLHTRLTEETTGMINKDLLFLMKKNAYLINTARAKLVNKADLLEVLQNKKIAGAALDVFWTEPIPVNDPFLKLDNVTLTAHIAGDTVDAITRSPYLLKNVMNDYFAAGFSKMIIH